MKVEVNEKQSPQVDWTKNPQLVISDDSTIVLALSTKEETEKEFHGIVLVENSLYKSGYFDKWFKHSFKPFHGEITLKND